MHATHPERRVREVVRDPEPSEQRVEAREVLVLDHGRGQLGDDLIEGRGRFDLGDHEPRLALGEQAIEVALEPGSGELGPGELTQHPGLVHDQRQVFG